MAKKGNIPWNKGLRGLTVLSDKTRQKMSEARRGHPYYPRTPEGMRKFVSAIKGRVSPYKGHHWTPEVRAKALAGRVGKMPSGENHPNWQGGLTPTYELIRRSAQYRDWRLAVLQRDDYRCIDCGAQGPNMEVDHLFPFSLYPRLRFMIENGITRCTPCHREAHRAGSRSLKAIRHHQRQFVTVAA